MFVVAMVGIVITMLLALSRAVLGPSVFDRLVAVNMFGTKTVLLIVVSGFLVGRPEWIDLALLYTLVNFVGTIAVCRFVRFGNLALDTIRRGESAGGSEGGA
ncbi:MAG TPA: monovalent cation/H+ antiporter complex subunit F [Thermoanaerobaculia bacterium]|nr:monovalent cation/H+ antiporter complex subunit F [Thermoanaerobaculia bacterium]